MSAARAPGEVRRPRLPFFLGPRAVGAVALAAASPLVLPGPPMVVLTVALLLVAAVTVADALAAPAPARLRVSRTAPGVTVVGRREDVVLTITNTVDRALTIDVHDASPPSLRRTPRRHRGVPLRALATVDLQATIEAERRGRRWIGPPTVRVAGRLGLAGRQDTIPSRDVVKIHPQLPGRRSALARLRNARRQPIGARATRLRGSGTTFDGLREYHPDDAFRHINWLATARATTPITNVYTEERNQQVLVLLDTSRTSAGSVAGVPRIEWAIDAAVALAEVAGRFRDHVGAATFDDRVRSYVPPRPGQRQAAQVLNATFDVRASLTAPAYRSAFASILARHGRRSLLVLLTDLTDEDTLAPLFDALPILLGRHLVTIAAVRDPGLDRLARVVPTGADDVYAKAAATAAVAGRERAARRLTRLGAHVLDEPPSRLAVALTDDYVTIKRGGAL